MDYNLHCHTTFAKVVDALSHILNNESGESALSRMDAAQYSPKANYDNAAYNAAKEDDQYLCTDAIATEKYVSSTYNNDLLQFALQKFAKL